MNGSHSSLRATQRRFDRAWAPGRVPVHPDPFHPILDDMTAGPFDRARSDRLAGGPVVIVVNAVAVALEIAVNLLQTGTSGGRQFALLG